MKESIPQENSRFTWNLIDQLVQQGACYFCLSPGSRSTPLALAIAEHKDTQAMVHFDERAMAFHALGYSMATGKPAVIVTTSGTAVGNLFPAVMEAFHSKIPLIILTADRPPELQQCGANQTVDQTKIFGSFVRHYISLACPDDTTPERYLATSVAASVYMSQRAPAGPVHLNVPLREPLFSLTATAPLPIIPTYHAPIRMQPSSDSIEKWASIFANVEKGVIVVGNIAISCFEKTALEPIFMLAQKLKWPILADILAPMRASGEKPPLIPYSDALLKIAGQNPAFKPEAILHLGDRLVSRTFLEWLANAAPSVFYALVTDHPDRHDPKHLVTHRFESDPSLFCKELLPNVLGNQEDGWLQNWQQTSENISVELETFFKEKKDLTEPGIVHFLKETLTDDCALFLSNSMPVRDMDQFFFAKQATGPVFCNRGVSGIDGNIATAIGIAQGCKKPVLALLGDLAALHDLNALAQLKKASYPVILLILNNQGGAIFSFFPISEKKEIFEEFFAASHPYSFEKAAVLFDVPYFTAQNKEEWEALLPQRLSSPISCVIELKTNRQENLLVHQEIALTLQEKILIPCCPHVVSVR